MTLLLSPRVWIALALAAFLAFTHFAAHRAGKAVVRAEWTAEKLETERLARLREQTLTRKNEEVANAYQLEKKRRAAADLLAADRLRDLTAALARADTAATVRTDDPRNRIIAECASALTQMDAAAGRLVDKVAGLRAYADRVCVTPP